MVYVLTGPIHSGKTTVLKGAASVWKNQGRRLGGFLSLARREGNDVVGYDLLDLKNNALFPFLRQAGDPAWPKSGSFYFLPEGLDKARGILVRDREEDLLIVDEIGPLEIRGEGLWTALNSVLRTGAARLCVVRRNLLDVFRKKLAAEKIVVFPCPSSDILELMTSEIFGAAGTSVRAGKKP